MVGLIIGIIFAIAWVGIIYEIVNAPLVDDNYNIIKENKDDNIKKK
jgi:hypothetical protein|tara:strand:+ start:85 stop:222 length:138 start_codon:yes stop_codon:yes gene_type:complete